MLLDEVGTGTDPAQGAALGVALLQALVKGGQRGSGFTMATTHHRQALFADISLFQRCCDLPYDCSQYFKNSYIMHIVSQN